MTTPTKTRPVRKQYVCKNCGSSDFLLWDAYAKWDVETQQMTLESNFDHVDCTSYECDGHETSVREVEL